jgi:hypothetical protein
MPDSVVVEGDTDRAIVKALNPQLDVPRSEGEKGRDAAINLAAVAVKQVGSPRIVLLLDRNGFTPEQIDSEVSRVLKREWKVPPRRSGPCFVFGGTLRIVLAGLPEDTLLRELGVKRFTADDYLLHLCLNDEALQAFCRGENNLSYTPRNASDLRAALTDVTSALRGRGIPIETSKRHLLLIMGIIGYQARRATFAEHMIGRCPEAIRDRVMGTLRNDIQNDP